MPTVVVANLGQVGANDLVRVCRAANGQRRGEHAVLGNLRAVEAPGRGHLGAARFVIALRGLEERRLRGGGRSAEEEKDDGSDEGAATRSLAYSWRASRRKPDV